MPIGICTTAKSGWRNIVQESKFSIDFENIIDEQRCVSKQFTDNGTCFCATVIDEGAAAAVVLCLAAVVC